MTAAGAGGRIARWSGGPLVGRDDLLDDLATAAEAAARGDGSIVLLTGEAGIGKTSVARVLARAVRDQLAVSWGTSMPDQSAPPYWPWQTLVTLEATDTAHDTDQTIGAARFERLTELREHVRTAALGQPRLHIIEDLQWADVASVLLLAHVGETIADMPLLVVATLRTGEPRASQLEQAIESVRRSCTARMLPVLDESDLAAMIRAAGMEADGQFVSVVHARTGGNPLFVAELLRAMSSTKSARGRLAMAADSVPDRVSDLVLDRLRRLPAAVSDAVASAAVVGAAGDIATLAAAHGLAAEPLLELLDQARAAHLLDAAPAGRWQFRHQLIRDAVYASMNASDRARRHVQTLEALAADPSTAPAAVAHHALAAQPLFDADRAVALAARAGEAAMRQYAYEEAVVWFTRALDVAPRDTSPRWRAELSLLVGEAHRHMGDVESARQAFVDAAELTDEPALLARTALGYADPGADLGIAYRTDDAVTVPLLERAIAAQSGGDSVVAVELEARLAAVLYFSDEPSRAREVAAAALDRARRLGHAGALVAATALIHDAFVVGQVEIEAQLAESAQLLAWAHDAGSVAALLMAHRARVFDLLAAGDLARMDAEILAFSRLAEPLRMPGYLWWPALWSAMRGLLEGRHDVAETRAVSAYEVGKSTFPLLSLFNLSFQLFFLRREEGRLDEMEAATRDYAASRADVPAIRVALTFLLAELGRLDEARATLDAFDDAALLRLHDRNWPASWFQLARAASIVADANVAATLLKPLHRPTERCIQVSLATVCLGAADLATAWLLQTIGQVDEADVHYRRAEELNARLGARSWLAQARFDHARLLMNRDQPGDREEAQRLDGLAQAAAREIGLVTLAKRTVLEHDAPAVGIFHREAAVWQVSFVGRHAQIPDSRGMHDIAFLLARQGEAVSVLELANESGGASVRGAPALDERARLEIRERLRQLDDDEAVAESAGDGERAAVAREQRQALAEVVARDFGLGGRVRRVGDPVERARKTVSTRIRRTIAMIGRAHPELARHLERSIDTGSWCAYRPPEPTNWRI